MISSGVADSSRALAAAISASSSGVGSSWYGAWGATIFFGRSSWLAAAIDILASL